MPHEILEGNPWEKGTKTRVKEWLKDNVRRRGLDSILWGRWEQGGRPKRSAWPLFYISCWWFPLPLSFSPPSAHPPSPSPRRRPPSSSCLPHLVHHLVVLQLPLLGCPPFWITKLLKEMVFEKPALELIALPDYWNALYPLHETKFSTNFLINFQLPINWF